MLPESGRGLAIMRACVDDVTLSSGPGLGTVVSLEKRMAWRSDAPMMEGRFGARASSERWLSPAATRHRRHPARRGPQRRARLLGRAR